MKKYLKAKIEEIYFDETDVIRTSGGGQTERESDSNMDPGGWDFFG